MRLALVWFILALGGATLAAITSSCSVNTRSDGFSCESGDCADPNRVCVDGVCVLVAVDAGRDGGGGTPDARRLDGGPPQPDAPTGDVCPEICTECIPGDNGGTGTCVIDCNEAGNTCFGTVACPPGLRCEVLCNLPGSCRNSVACPLQENCDITCTGENSCRSLRCGKGPCQVECGPDSECRGIACGQSCACDVTCDGEPNQVCFNVLCPGVACGAFDGGCDSEGLGCDTCE